MELLALRPQTDGPIPICKVCRQARLISPLTICGWRTFPILKKHCGAAVWMEAIRCSSHFLPWKCTCRDGHPMVRRLPLWTCRQVTPGGWSYRLDGRQSRLDHAERRRPTWAPDGKSIIFGTSCDKDDSAVFRLDLKSKATYKIPGSEKLCSPRLLPDGRYISAQTNDGGKVMLFDASTNKWSNLAQGKNLGFNEWSRDGKYVYLRATSDGPEVIPRQNKGSFFGAPLQPERSSSIHHRCFHLVDWPDARRWRAGDARPQHPGNLRCGARISLT